MKNVVVFAMMAIMALASCKKNNDGVTTPPPQPPPPQPPSVVLKTADSVLIVNETVSGAKEAARLAQNNPASDFYTTGFYLPASTVMTVEVTAEIGTRLPTLLVGTYSRYQASWNPTSHTLTAGVNSITDAIGGILYVRFHNDNPSGRVRLKFISGMRPVPYYQLGRTTQADWVKMVDNINNVPDVQLVGNKTIITFSLVNARTYKNETQEALIKKADRVIAIEDSISGLFGSDPIDLPNVHKYLMTETDHPGYFMAATFYRTFYSSVTGGVPAILTADNLNWGPWHELGHMHQQGSWTWSELGEVTVNIYSIAVEKAFGIIPTRLTSQNEWNNTITYLALPEAERNFNGSNASVWTRLCMFQQLKLAFGESFYHELHRQARRETNSPTTTDTRMRWFMLKACSISRKNLTSFFQKWGMKLSTQSATDAVFTEITALGLPAPAQDITLLTD
ncbi:MAG TPA: M60 family metallopeptidase [Chitinophagaceae bacterium]|nr:M60 family metallopeptidase [Chitinophagaceae bacterium]